MKKILLIIFIIILILSVNVLAVVIDVGNAAIDRDSTTGAGTRVDKLNPANASGKITSIEIWANLSMTGCEVATFFVVSGNNLSTRDWEYIGPVTAGSKQTFPVDLDVEEGDYIGIYYSSGTLERSTGANGYWYTGGDQIPCTDLTFSVSSTGGAISLYGMGATVGWDHKWNTQTISTWNGKEIIKWNGLE